MPNFKKFSRFDPSLAESGVRFRVTDEMGNEYGRFLCALVDNHNPRTKKARERFRLRYNAQKNNKAYTDQIAVAELFVELSLLDWEMDDEDGKPIPFERGDAIDFLAANPFVLERLDTFAADVTNYATVAPETAVKN